MPQLQSELAYFGNGKVKFLSDMLQLAFDSLFIAAPLIVLLTSRAAVLAHIHETGKPLESSVTAGKYLGSEETHRFPFLRHTAMVLRRIANTFKGGQGDFYLNFVLDTDSETMYIPPELNRAV